MGRFEDLKVSEVILKMGRFEDLKNGISRFEVHLGASHFQMDGLRFKVRSGTRHFQIGKFSNFQIE